MIDEGLALYQSSGCDFLIGIGGGSPLDSLKAIAALEGGIVINNASVTIVHGMSRPIGALFHVAHGTSNAMLLPSCMAFAMDGALDRFADLGRAIDVATKGDSDQVAAENFIAALAKLCTTCQIPTPEEYGIPKEDFFAKIDKMATDALASGSPSNTRKPVTKEDMVALYQNLYQ